jgi:hypothetical protein
LGALVVQKSTGHILVGNHRYKAAIALGMSELPVHYVDVSDEQATKILLADNAASDLSVWDEDLLAELLTDLEDLEGSLMEAPLPEPELSSKMNMTGKGAQLTLIIPISDFGLLEDAITATGFQNDRSRAFREILESYVNKKKITKICEAKRA